MRACSRSRLTATYAPRREIAEVVSLRVQKTVFELKELLSPQCNLAAGAQRLIFKGKVLQDDQTLASYGALPVERRSLTHSP